MADQVFTDEQINEILSIFTQNLGHRQYIGARYVPIFGRKDEESIEWDNSAPYEPLTIVLYQGNSYTSRQYVPVGIGIDNVDFWAETGNYNAQVEQYRAEVRAFDGRITQNAEDIAENAENIAASDEKLDKEIQDRLLTTNVVIADDGVIKENAISRGAVGGLVILGNYLYAVTNYSSNTGHDIIKMDLEGNIIDTADITSLFPATYHVNQISKVDGYIAVQVSGTLIKLIDESYQYVKSMPTYSSNRAFDFFRTADGKKYLAFMSDNPINPYEIFFNEPDRDLYVQTDITIENNSLFFNTLEQAMHVDWPLLINIQSYSDGTYCDTINIRCGGRNSGSIYFPEIEEEIEGITTDATYLYLCGGTGSLYKYRKENLFRNMMYDWYKDSNMSPYNIVGAGIRHSKTGTDYTIPFEQNGQMKVIAPLIWTQASEKVTTILIYGIGGNERPNLLGYAPFGGANPNAHTGFLNQGTHLPVIPITVYADSHVNNANVNITVKESNGNTAFTNTSDFLNYINGKWSTDYSKLGIFLTSDVSFKFSVIGFE